MTAAGNRPQTSPGERSFETAIAQQVGIIRSNLEAILDRNPDASAALRAALVRAVGKCMPLCDVEHLKRTRWAYESPTVAVEVRFTEADRSTGSDT